LISVRGGAHGGAVRITIFCLLALGCPHGSLDRAPPDPAAARGSAGDSADAATLQRCHADADCALTRVPEGGCCPTLCAPRAVAREEAERLEANVPRCHKGGTCPEPACRPPSSEVTAACVQSRCATRAGPPAN
jgi:hypothetical protein